MTTREHMFSLTRKDFRVETFTAGGPGGQHQNRRETAVRITHPDSGAVGQSREARSQQRNRHIALQRLVADPRFQAWVRRRAGVGDPRAGTEPTDRRVRTYNLAKGRVTDHRTGQVDHSPRSVLDGELGPFIDRALVMGDETGG